MNLPLAEMFTEEGAAMGIVLWAAAILALTQIGKKLIPMLPSSGPAVLWIVVVLAGAVTGLAIWDAVSTAGMVLGPDSVVQIFSLWLALTAAAIGEFEAGSAAVGAAMPGKG